MQNVTIKVEVLILLGGKGKARICTHALGNKLAKV